MMSTYCYNLTNLRVLHIKYNLLETNPMTTESVTILTEHALIEGRDILPDVFRKEDIMKGVLIGVTHMEPRSAFALNKTTFLVTSSSGI